MDVYFVGSRNKVYNMLFTRRYARVNRLMLTAYAEINARYLSK